MNKKAFTLVELLVTIVIIGLIALMGFPSLQRMLNGNATKEIEIYGKSMIGAAKMYMQKEGRDINENANSKLELEGNGYMIGLKTLIDQDYIETFKPSKKNIQCDLDNASVRVRKETQNTLKYDYKLKCTYKDKVYRKSYDDTTPNITKKEDLALENVMSNDTKGNYHSSKYKTKVTKIITKNVISIPANIVEKWDVSQANDGSVIAYAENDGNGGYIITICSDGKTYLNGTYDYLFFSFPALVDIDLSNFNTNKVISMKTMFGNCNNLQRINLSSFDTSQVTSMSSMFNGCIKLSTLDLSNFNTSKVISMSGMFEYCYNLENINLSSFDTTNAINMSSMFDNCQRLTSLDISNFKTSNVRYMDYMFANCDKISTLDLNNFDTSNVTTMAGMFYECKGLTNLNINNFKTQKVTDMNRMFCGCALTSIDLSNFNTSAVKDMGEMFAGNSFIQLNLNNFNTSQLLICHECFAAVEV
mgnify:CR=1 FL=1